MLFKCKRIEKQVINMKYKPCKMKQDTSIHFIALKM